MSDLIKRIEAAKKAAGERVVMDDLREKGLGTLVEPQRTGSVVPPGHPWADFLNARARAIDWLYYREGPCMHNDAAIARTLSMDPTQVMLIRMRDEKPGDNRGQLKPV